MKSKVIIFVAIVLLVGGFGLLGFVVKSLNTEEVDISEKTKPVVLTEDRKSVLDEVDDLVVKSMYTDIEYNYAIDFNADLVSGILLENFSEHNIDVTQLIDNSRLLEGTDEYLQRVWYYTVEDNQVLFYYKEIVAEQGNEPVLFYKVYEDGDCLCYEEVL